MHCVHLVLESISNVFEKRSQDINESSCSTSDRRVLKAALFLSCRYSSADMGRTTEQVAGKGAIGLIDAPYMFQGSSTLECEYFVDIGLWKTPMTILGRP